MLAVCYLIAGLVASVAGVAGLCGPWWALILLGVELVALGVLEARGAALTAPATNASTGEGGDQ